MEHTHKEGWKYKEKTCHSDQKLSKLNYLDLMNIHKTEDPGVNIKF